MAGTFVWTKRRRRAAQLVAEGELNSNDLAAAVGVSRMALYTWRQAPAFAERVQALTAGLNASLERRAISHRVRRVARQNAAWLKLQQVIKERAADPAMGGVPGGKTGLLVARRKMLGTGENAIAIVEYEFDASVAKELRELERHAATELGEWTEKLEQQTKGAVVVRVSYDDVSPLPLPAGEHPANN